LALAVFWQYRLRPKNHGASPGLLIAKKTSNRLETDRNGHPEVQDYGRNN
jgi:hypothetical protein